MKDVRRVLVIGGGVGGLSAATAMAQRNTDVLLIDKVPAFEVPGVGLGQPANALRVYRELGVLRDVLDAGFTYDRMHIFDHNRKLIASHQFLLGDDDTPAVCALPRSTLHNILRSAAEAAGVGIRLGVTAVSLDEGETAVAVKFSDNRTDDFDVVIGFDGIRSAAREHVYGTAFVPRPSGYGAWRFQVSRPDYVRGMEFLQGIGSKTGAMPLSDDLMYVFHIRPEDPDAWFAKDDFVRLLQRRLSPYGSYVAEARDALNEHSGIVYSPIESLLVPWPWHRGRVVIGGDAVHTFPPHLTQGAAMAVEDALVLAEVLGRSQLSMEERLRAYASRRYPRCAFVYSFSKQWLEDEQSVNSPERLAVARAEIARNASKRIAVSDRILNEPVLERSSEGVLI